MYQLISHKSTLRKCYRGEIKFSETTFGSREEKAREGKNLTQGICKTKKKKNNVTQSGFPVFERDEVSLGENAEPKVQGGSVI